MELVLKLKDFQRAYRRLKKKTDDGNLAACFDALGIDGQPILEYLTKLPAAREFRRQPHEVAWQGALMYGIALGVQAERTRHVEQAGWKIEG
jgi:hypothetical protein